MLRPTCVLEFVIASPSFFSADCFDFVLQGCFQGQLRDAPSSLESDDSLNGNVSVDGMMPNTMGAVPPFGANMEHLYGQKFTQQYLTALQAVGAQLNENSSQSLLYDVYGSSGGRYPTHSDGGALPGSHFSPNAYNLDPNMLLAVHFQMMAAHHRTPVQPNDMMQPQEAYNNGVPDGYTDCLGT